MSKRSASSYSRSSRLAAAGEQQHPRAFRHRHAVHGHVFGEHAGPGTATAASSAASPRPRPGSSPGRRGPSSTRRGCGGTAPPRSRASFVRVSVPAEPISDANPITSASVSRASRAVFGVDLRFAQLRDEAVVGMRGLVGEQVVPVPAGLAHRLDRVVGDVGRLLEPVERGVHQCRNVLRSAAGTPRSSMITFIGQHRRELLDEVAAALSTSGSRQSIAVLRTNGSSSEIARGDERAAHELALHVVLGRVHEDHHGEHRLGVEALDHGALGRAVEQGLLRRVEHVGVARQCVEPERVVAVAGLLVTEPPVHRVRVLVELVGERVKFHPPDRFTRRMRE